MTDGDMHMWGASPEAPPMCSDCLQEAIDLAWEEKDPVKVHYWQCICGCRACPLTDDTECLCTDYYESDWSLVEFDWPVRLTAGR